MNIYSFPKEHTANDRTPYTYLIGWSKHNKWYYGLRYAKNCHPADLWKSYFTSSRVVKNLYKKLGDPDVIQIRSIHKSKEAAIRWESTVLRRLKVNVAEEFLNISANPFKHAVASGEMNHLFGLKRPEHSKFMKIKENNWFANHKFCGENNHFFGKSHSEETKEIIRKKNAKPMSEKIGEERASFKSKKHSDYMLKHNPFKGKKHSEKTKKIMSEKAKTRPKREHAPAKIYECSVCGKSVAAKINLTRWHENNCKFLTFA